MKKILTTIEIPVELSNYLESLHYEANCRSALLTYLIKQDVANNDSFKAYNDEYREYFMKYEIAKQELYDTYIKAEWDGKPVEWELKFPEHLIYITEM